MAKLTLTDLASFNGAAVTTLNNNFALIEEAIENTLSRDGDSPNTMSASLDMNSNRIQNLIEAVGDTEPVRKAEFDEELAALETTVSNIASTAQGYANQALAALDEFTDIYLGAKASDPTLDNDGNALSTGDLYFNTTTNLLKVYSGSAWNNVIAALTGANLDDLADVDLTGAGSGDLLEFNGTTWVDGINKSELAQLAENNNFTGSVQQITSASADSVRGPGLVLWRNSASPANNDFLGYIAFEGKDSGGNSEEYASIRSFISDVTNGSEAGGIAFWSKDAGTGAERGYFQDGLVWGAATGGDQGAGTINAVNFFDDGANINTIYASLASANDFLANITITSSDGGADRNPALILYRNSATPAVSDYIGNIRFEGEDSSGGSVEYASIRGFISQPTAGVPRGTLDFWTIRDGTNAERGYFGAGFVVSSGETAGGDMGAGNINANDYYDDGVNINTLYQPLDADLTAIAALTTTAYGRGLLELADETALEALLDTLPNLTSIQGRTVTLADAGANAFFGWDDVAGAYENLTAAEAEAIIEPLIDTLANLTSIQGLTITLADAGADAIFGWDDSAAAYQNLSAADARAALGLATSDSPQFTAIELGHASDTTLTRVSAGVVAIEGSNILTEGTAEAFVETAIDTLANLTSIQGLTVTLADAGADAILGWDDSAAAYENLTQAEVRAVAGLATTDSPEFTAINLGHASDTTLARVSAGVVSIEGVNILTTSTGETLGTRRGINNQTANYTLVLTDAGKLVEMENAADRTITIPPNSSVAFPTGTWVDFVRKGAGELDIVAGVGVTILSGDSWLSANKRYSGLTAVKIATDTWYLFGDLKA